MKFENVQFVDDLYFEYNGSNYLIPIAALLNNFEIKILC